MNNIQSLGEEKGRLFFFVCALELWIIFTLLYKIRRLFKKPSYWAFNHILLKQVFHLVEMSTKMCASPFNSFLERGFKKFLWYFYHKKIKSIHVCLKGTQAS